MLEAMRSRGWIGVDLFFVISGYLITSILLATRERPHYYRNFYARRGLRIWPLYYLLLLFVFGLSAHLGAWARQDVDWHVIHWQYYLLYLQNLVYPHLGSFALVVTWSLCVEEQFYLVWPFIVRLCSRRMLTGVALAILLLGTPFRMWLHHIDSGMGFFFTFTRLDPIAAGALAALHPRWFKHTWLAAPWAVWLLHRGEFEFVYLALALTFVSLLTHTVSSGNRVLRAGPLRFAGKVSYGLYIFHPVVFSIFWLTPAYSAVAHWRYANLARMAGQVLLPIPFAALSWYLFEQPILKLKRWFEADSPHGAWAMKCPVAEATD
jgi:peptidoglycan/LPS O-acetylase OafA/YrhL